MTEILSKSEPGDEANGVNNGVLMKKYGREGLEERVQALAEQLGFETFVSKLQRRLGPLKLPNDDPAVLARSSGKEAYHGEDETSSFEVFVGALSADVFEDELYDLVSKRVDPTSIELIRVMTNENGDNRGFAFVRLKDKDSCFKLVRELHDYEFRPKRLIKANYSPPNVRIYVANLPKNKDKDELKSELERVTEGVKDIIVHQGDKKNRGFCFVDYFTHPLAKSALRKLGLHETKVFGHNVYAEWAEPFQEVDPEVMAKVRTLYVRNVSPEVTEEEIQNVFGKFGPIEKVRRQHHYAFVHFVEREHALAAKEALNNTQVGRNNIEIDLARPAEAAGNQKGERGARGGRGGRGGGQYGMENWYGDTVSSPWRGGSPRAFGRGAFPPPPQPYGYPGQPQYPYYGQGYTPPPPRGGPRQGYHASPPRPMVPNYTGYENYAAYPSQPYYDDGSGSAYADPNMAYPEYPAGGEVFYEDTEPTPMYGAESYPGRGKRPAAPGSAGAYPPKRFRGGRGAPRRGAAGW